MRRGDRFKKEHTLCWDCAKATDDACPWVDAGMPVPGWWATPSKIKTCGICSDSYRVIKCPLFVRDADKAGLVKVPQNGIVINTYRRGTERKRIIINYTENDIELDGVSVPAQRAVAVR